jgi:hypothetical protein
MPFHYVHVDSAKGKNPQHSRSEVDINLLKPIQNVIGMKLLDFSIGNEFFNCIEGNQTFTILLFKAGSDGGTTPPNTDVGVINLTIPIAFYTHTELIAELNKQYAATTGFCQQFSVNPTSEQYDVSTTSVAHNNDIIFSVTSNNPEVDIYGDTAAIDGEYTKIQISASSATLFNRAVLYHQSFKTFQSSLVHRLGFTAENVLINNMEEHVSILGGIQNMLGYHKTESESRYFFFDGSCLTWNHLFNQEELVYVAEGGSYLVFKTTHRTPTPVDSREYPHFKISTFKCFENIEAINISCDLLIDDSQTFQFGEMYTHISNTLARINVNVSHGSFLTYSGGSQEEYYHNLDGRDIKKFRLTLHHGKTNKIINRKEARDWTATILFETKDEISQKNINQTIALQLQEWEKKIKNTGNSIQSLK